MFKLYYQYEATILKCQLSVVIASHIKMDSQ